MNKHTIFETKLDWENGIIEMSHGSGGKSSFQIISQLFAKHFDNEILNQGNDQAIFSSPPGRLAISTDSHVISPIFFPGGNIGTMSIYGTINDLAVGGADPLYLTCGFIIEEGFPLKDLKLIVESMGDASKRLGIPIVTGDTKIVERGNGDGVFITTTGLGVIQNETICLSGANAKPGDKILINGTIGDHGIAILSQRENLSFHTSLKSDHCSLHELIQSLLFEFPDIHVMRDPTRGGVAATLNEICHQSQVGMRLDESALPLKEEVEGACELLGLDPIHVANEGKVLIICAEDRADSVLEKMRQHPLGAQGAIVGEVLQDENHFLQMTTKFGGNRLVHWMSGEQLPRIC